ncbi:hypothetical protein JYB88_15740 [Shewanella cyperi]|uniref:Uncharacterized protein n=1 Tax=Shewanella cyperi TaxID=2814292 RepID=A0A974XJP0_9GAMM|nr:hypothetical protein [Shewanella cyperi]QSX29629.1 hypothetical protein JYB88_15740 [Shewanella cyperi]
MTPAIKAALIATFVFPGGGHLYLKKTLRGALLAAVACACLLFLMTLVYDSAQTIASGILGGSIALNTTAIAQAMDASQVELEAKGGSVSWILLCTWLLGIIDGYRLGRKAPSQTTDGTRQA